MVEDKDRTANQNSSLNNPMSRDKLNTSNNINNDGLYNISIYDTMTGKKIPFYTIQDSILLAKKGESIESDGTAIYDHVVPSALLNEFIVSSGEHFNARSCVEAIGLYNTDYIRQQITTIGDKEMDLGAMETRGVEDNLTFRNYLKGGANPRTVDNKEAPGTADENYPTLHVSKGIGLGEASVLNPTFQFNKRDDPRTNPLYPKIGRVYSTSIMNNWPVILFQPGRLKYNNGFIKMLGLGGGAGLTEAYIRSGGDGIKGVLTKCLNSVGDLISVIGTVGSAIFGGSKIVEFKQSINMFNQYVTSIWYEVAAMMGLTDNKDGRYCGAVVHLDLAHVLPILSLNGGIAKYHNEQFIPFRCNSNMVGSETFSNSTTSNPLMEELNSQATANDDAAQGKSIGQTAKKWMLGVLGTVSDRAAVMAGQGRVVLPDVFESSSFSRTVSCSFEFHYPYGDTFGKFENCYLQFLTLMCMGVCRQTGKMTYTSPFALRVFIKNHIMINCGMIESISVTRGGDSNDWCPDGHPKTLKVDVTIKDLEPNISLPLATRGPLRMALEVMFPASGMSEYLGTIAGLPLDELTHNFRKNHLKRAWNMFQNSWSSKFDPDTFMASIANTRAGSAILGLFAGTDLDHYNDLGNSIQMTAKEAMTNINNNKFNFAGYMGTALTSGGFKNFTSSQALEKSVNSSIENDAQDSYLPK